MEGQDLLERARLHNAFSIFLKEQGELCPGDTVPVIATSRRRIPLVFPMSWGYPLQKKLVINARLESCLEKALFRESAEHRRCLIPASYYYEWDHSSPSRDKYAIRPAHPGLFYLGGLYRMEQGMPQFVILTRSALSEITFIHDRMPLILAEELRDSWLCPDKPFEQLPLPEVPKMEYMKVS